MIYLDYNATAPIRPEVREAVAEAMASPTNPSSVHRYGRHAKKHIEDAREVIAQAVSAFPNEVIFTASGTEANNLALCGISGVRLLVSAIEHPSVLKVVEGIRHSREPRSGKSGIHNPQAVVMDSRLRGNDSNLIPVINDGFIDMAALEATLSTAPEKSLLSVMLANNETGVIQPIEEISQIVRKYGIMIHCDASQALGKIPVDFGRLGVDMLTLSAHKMGGPQGAGALIVRNDLPIKPLLLGGGQELGRRAGTENVAAIAGFAKAVEVMANFPAKEIRAWLEAMESELQAFAPEMVVFGKNAARLPNTSCLTMPGVSAETQLMSFDLAGIAVSAGSACSSGRVQVSHVLKAMGVPENIASTAIRISGGWGTTEADIQRFTEVWKSIYTRVRGAAVALRA